MNSNRLLLLKDRIMVWSNTYSSSDKKLGYLYKGDYVIYIKKYTGTYDLVLTKFGISNINSFLLNCDTIK
jgi:hypothetical protein